MKRIALVAALATLAACQQEAATAPEAAPEATTAAAATPAAAVLAADGKASTGMFQITTADGKVYMEEVKADGTYVSKDKDGKVSETGKWVQKSPTLYCTTKDAEGAKEVCNTEGVDAAGVWTTTNPDTKNTATVVRVES